MTRSLAVDEHDEHASQSQQRIVALHVRPGKLTRSKVYAPFTSYGVTLTPGTKPIYLYLRRSKFHGDDGDAIERHRVDLTRQLDDEGGWTIMGEFIDNDSASKSAAYSRKGWKILGDMIASSQVRAVAFWKLDRTSRNAIQQLTWLAHCRDTHVTLRSCQDDANELKMMTSGAKMIVAVKAMSAEIETDGMSVRQLDSKRHKAEKGFHHGGMLPFGWMKSDVRETAEDGTMGKRIVAHPVEFPALCDAVDMTLTGKTLTDVARYWRDEYGIVRADGGTCYTSTVLRALRSPRLVGYRMRNVPEHVRGVRLKLMDYIARDETGKPVKSHQAVCDLRTFHRLQRKLDESNNAPTRKPWGSVEWELTGLLFCGTCGNVLRGITKPDRLVDGTRVNRERYQCRANVLIEAGTCSCQVTVKRDVIEAYVHEQLGAYLDPARIAQRRAARDVAARAQLDDGVQAQLDTAYEERETLRSLRGKPPYDGSGVAELLATLVDVSERIDRLEAQTEIVESDELPELTRDELHERWAALGLAEKRALLARCIGRIVVEPTTRGAKNVPMAERVRVTFRST